MKVVLLAGGLGTRIAEETSTRPKPMIEIGGQPIICHIMNIYTAAGFNEFVVALGYKGEIVKDFFANYRLRNSDLIVDVGHERTEVRTKFIPPWRIHLIDTGSGTQTGGRILRLREIIGNERFMVTYGDGVAKIDIAELLRFHIAHGKTATLTAVRPPARFGSLDIADDSHVMRFMEKPQVGEGWINGGFFVFEPRIFDYLENDATVLEQQPLEALAADNELVAYRLYDFWQPMDTLREKSLLEELWKSGSAPWKVWNDHP